MHVHELRKYSSAVMVGIGTAVADDPLLTARGHYAPTQPRRVVIDPDLRLPISSKLVESINEAPLLIASRQGASADRIAAMQAAGAEVFELPPAVSDRPGDTQLDIKPLLQHLVEVHKAHRIMVEGGPRLIGTMFAQQLIDEAKVFIAPKLLGDENGRSAVVGRSCELMTDAINLEVRMQRNFGDDVMIAYRVKYD
jgi:diaminohydroxyphosphoribosylaminopyrimidine deaminase/5-amino-6-(5-phosphoribosylamino)uracil reductase